MFEPIWITGTGIVSAIGIDKEETCRHLLDGETGIGEIRYLQTEHREFPVGEVKLSNEEMIARLRFSDDRPVTRTALIGMIALGQALEEAKISRCGLSSVGFLSGTTVGGMDKSEQYYPDYLSNDTRNDYIALHDCGSCSELIAEHFGRFAFISTPSTACSSAANSIILAANLIRSGYAETVVAGGSECLSKFHLNGFNSLMILDKEPCRPFDRTRAGLNLGEGAAFLVLESAASARRRGVSPLALLGGYGNTCDAFHQTASSSDGEGAFLAMRKAVESASLRCEDIVYINAHGTGTPNNDESESTAIRRLFGSRIPFVSSTKSFTGHTTSASGSIESVICILAMQHGFLPKNLHWHYPMPEGIVPVCETIRNIPVRHVLCNSFGFGGNNSSLLFSNPCLS